MNSGKKQKILVFFAFLWYNRNVVLRRFYMLNEEKFAFDIANIQKDLEMEDMTVKPEDVELLRRYSNEEITMPEIIHMIKTSIN